MDLLLQSVNGFMYITVYRNNGQKSVSTINVHSHTFAYFSTASRGSSMFSTFSKAATFLRYAPKELPTPSRPPVPMYWQG